MRDRKVIYLPGLLLVACFGGGIHAQTLIQRQTMTHEDGKLNEEGQTARRICGTAIVPSFNWKSFIAADKVGDMTSDSNDNPPSNMCSVPLRALESMCQDALAKQAIAAKIKSYTCTYQAGPKQTLSLDPSGKLELTSSYEAFHSSGDPNGFVEDWLGKHL